MNRSGRRPMEKPAESTPSDGRPARKPNPGTMRLPGSAPKSEQAHQGPRSAFFDLDGTLVAGVTGVLLTQDTFRRREIGIGEFLGVVQSAVNHQLGRADFEDLVHKCLMSAVSR